MANAKTYDERDRQGKALRAWERQQQQWVQTEKNLAAKLGKKPDETLPATIHNFRRRQEELGMIDASVPAEIKNGISAWEMNLRSGSGGVRYVQVGSSYPYPLYCPIRDSEAVKPDNHILMRVIPEFLPERDKPVSEGEYFKTKQNEFKKHVKRKFAHFVADPEPLLVVGVPPPKTKNPIKDDNTVEPVIFVLPKEKRESNAGNQSKGPAIMTSTPTTTAMDAVDARQIPSRPLSAVSSKSQEPIPTAQDGPMLMFSAAHLSFVTQPNVAAHATLKVSNIGSTAVFYSWSVCTTESILDDRKKSTDDAGPKDGLNGSNDPQEGVQGLFRLSAPNDGVFLPDDDTCFTFMFRSAVPGAFVQQYELLTVPAGKERIIVQLRGVVLRNDSDALGVSALSHAMSSRSMKMDSHNLFTEILNRPVENCIDEAHIRMLLAERNQQKEVIVNKEVELQEKRESLWVHHNTVLKIPFNEAVYEKIFQLHHHFQQLMAEVQPPAPASQSQVQGSRVPSGVPEGGSRASSPALDARPNTSPIQGPTSEARTGPQEWSGSLRSFLEDLTAVKDVQIRTSFLTALSTLRRCAEVSTNKAEPLSTLVLRASSQQAWSEAIDDIALCSSTARDLAEGRGTLKGSNRDAKDPKGKSAAAKKVAASGNAKDKDKNATQQQEKNVDDNAEVKAEYDDLFFNLSRRVVGDLVQNMLTLQENATNTIETLCDRETGVLLSWRMDDIKKKYAENEVDLDPVMETAQKGKKK